MTKQQRTKEEQILVLETLISERSLIIYVIESDLQDNEKDRDPWYNAALRDEIENHNLALMEYKEGLDKLKPII